ncbi:MAG: DUF2225 domain-containing protein [Selenomonadaceae bacterium]|nr:DUF2225 domain-containing protein [Selenomonadaceae bacterium]
MTKAEFLQLLRDPDICKEIFEIVKKGGKPTVEPTKFTSIGGKLKHMYPNAVAPQQQSTPQPSQPPTPKPTQSQQPPPQPSQPKPAQSAQPNLSSIADKLKFLRGHINKIEDEKIAAEEAAKAAEAARSPAEKFTVVLQKRCPICEKNSRVIKPKARLNVEKRDLDYCVHYKDFNPYLYTIFACEHCGFAAEEKKFSGVIPNKTKESLREFLKQNDMKLPFVEERTSEDGLSFFELAILFSELTDQSKGRQAILNLNAAWLCRCEGLPDREREFMEQAAEDFAVALDNERWPINGISDDMATYLCAAIYFLLKDYDSATKWLGRTMNNATLRTTAPKLFEQARDIWQEIKRITKA